MITRYFGGSFYVGSGRWVSEIYVADGKVCTPTRSDVEIDIQGATLLPAFRDGHAHPFFAGQELLGLDVSSAESLSEIAERLVAYKIQNPQKTWISGGAFNRALPGQLTRQFLDTYVRDTPVSLHADDHHTIWVNSRALEIAGLLDGPIPAVSVGSVDLGADGLPNGILRENEAIDLVLRHQPKSSPEDNLQAHLVAEETLIRDGITSVQDAWVDQDLLNSYLRFKDQLKLDYQLAMLLMPQSLEEDLETAKTAIEQLSDQANIKIQSVKIFIDGVFGSATALVSEPYLSTGAHGDQNWTKQDLERAINSAHQLGLQTHIHCIGDQAIAFALAAIENSDKGKLQPVLAHAELTNPPLIQKIKSLGVSVCVQPYWAQNNDMLNSCEQHLGKARKDSLYAFREMLEAGINVAFSSDWPVSSHKPLEGIAVAVHRKLTPDMTEHNQSQSITLEQAIDAYTLSNLRMLGTGASVLNPGDDFDAVLISGDLKAKNLEDLVSSEVLAVFRKGVSLLPKHHHG